MSPPTSALVLLPGFMCDAGLWDDVVAGLPERTDVHHADFAADATLESMAERALDETPERIALVGFSMGGYVAREMALRAPARVTHMVLVNTSARGVTASAARRNRVMAELVRKRPFTGLTNSALKRAVHPDRADDEALRTRIQEMAIRLGKDTFARQLSLPRADGHEQLPHITCPTLVVWSRQDVMRSFEESEELARGIPGARLEIIEECGHMTPMERPGELADLLTAHVFGACP